jgi:hypothetical protein
MDDGYVQVLDEQQDVGSGVGPADADVAEPAGQAQGDAAGFVDLVVADAVVGVGAAVASGAGLGQGRVEGRAGRAVRQGPVRPVVVVELDELVQQDATTAAQRRAGPLARAPEPMRRGCRCPPLSRTTSGPGAPAPPSCASRRPAGSSRRSAAACAGGRLRARPGARVRRTVAGHRHDPPPGGGTPVGWYVNVPARRERSRSPWDIGWLSQPVLSRQRRVRRWRRLQL